MHQVDHAEAAHQTMRGPAVLALDQLDEARVAFVLHAVITNEKRLFAVLEQSADQCPEMTGGQRLALQIIRHRVVAYTVQMLREMRACEVGDRTDEILDVLKFGNHDRILPCGSLKRKSYM